MSHSVYIVLTNTGSIVSKTIKMVTNAAYTHASLSLDEGLKETYSFARRQPTNPFWAGFIKEDFVHGTFSWFPYSTCIIYELEISDSSHNKLIRLIRYFEKKSKNYHYNYFGLLGVPLNLSIGVPSTYFCSQLVAEVLKRSGVELFSKKSSLVSPDDFYGHPHLKRIYEGEIYQYPNLYSKGYYHPNVYHSFPFRKYLKEQFYDEIFKSRSGQRQYLFGDGFIKPKKIYLSSKIKDTSKLIKRLKWYERK